MASRAASRDSSSPPDSHPSQSQIAGSGLPAGVGLALMAQSPKVLGHRDVPQDPILAHLGSYHSRIRHACILHCSACLAPFSSIDSGAVVASGSPEDDRWRERWWQSSGLSTQPTTFPYLTCIFPGGGRGGVSTASRRDTSTAQPHPSSSLCRSPVAPPAYPDRGTRCAEAPGRLPEGSSCQVNRT